jgi:hypothetical protein
MSSHNDQPTAAGFELLSNLPTILSAAATAHPTDPLANSTTRTGLSHARAPYDVAGPVLSLASPLKASSFKRTGPALSYY